MQYVFFIESDSRLIWVYAYDNKKQTHQSDQSQNDIYLFAYYFCIFTIQSKFFKIKKENPQLGPWLSDVQRTVENLFAVRKKCDTKPKNRQRWVSVCVPTFKHEVHFVVCYKIVRTRIVTHMTKMNAVQKHIPNCYM